MFTESFAIPVHFLRETVNGHWYLLNGKCLDKLSTIVRSTNVELWSEILMRQLFFADLKGFLGVDSE